MRNSILLSTFCSFFFLINGLYAQKKGCELITKTTIEKLIFPLEENDFQEVEVLLNMIESSCGKSEFTQRLRILGLMIQKKDTRFDINLYTSNQWDLQLIDRLDYAAQDDFDKIYKKDPSGFNYVPLKHAVDSLISIKSSAIIGSDMFNLNDQEEALAFLFSDHIDTYLMRTAQERKRFKTEELQELEINKDQYGFVISSGIYTPLYAVNPIFKTNPYFGVSVLSPLNYKWGMEIFFKARINSNDRDFEYKLYDDIETVNSKASFLFGGGVTYKMVDLGKFIVLGKGNIAVETVSTGLKETVEWDSYDEYGNNSSIKFHNVNTFNTSAAVALMQHIGGRKFLGLQGSYHYSPYSIDRRLRTEITPSYISVELFIKF